MKIGFIGLGRMGKPMAVNAIEAGFEVAGYDLRAEAVRDLAKLGGHPTGSPKEAARPIRGGNLRLCHRRTGHRRRSGRAGKEAFVHGRRRSCDR
jgi:UDP-N-acetyl-D-mannosaminuronate dehydrogenase